MVTKFGSPPNPRRLQDQAAELRERANSELDPKRRENMRSLASDLERQFQSAMRQKA